MAKVLADDFYISATPLNPRWEGFGGLRPVCSCGSNMAQRFDEKPWRCHRGHFVKGVTKTVLPASEEKA